MTLETECLFLCSITAYESIFFDYLKNFLVYGLQRDCCASNAIALFINHGLIINFLKVEKK